MRTVWSPATRPKLSSFAAPRATIKSIAARRAAAAANASRQVAACDVFAFILGPVLAAAAFADVSWKERKRKEWERRFAEINAQLEELRAREVEVWRRIQYHSVRHGVLQHRRMYSTTVAAPVPDSQPLLGDSVNMHLFDGMNWTEPDANWDRGSFPIRQQESNPAALESLGDLPVDSPLIRYEKLLALRLALRMLLHICAGSDDLRARELRSQRPHVSAEDIGGVVVRLQAVTDELDKSDLRHGALRRKKVFRHDSPESQAEEDLWRTELHQLGQLYRDKQIDIATLVDRLSNILLPADRKPPGPEFYARVTMLLSINNLPELASHAISALKSTSYVLSHNDICLMLNHSSHSRNYKAYDWVIHNLTDANGVLACESNRWRWVRLSGILLPMPRDEHPGLMRGLIRSALNFNDPKTAEAYAQNVPWIRSGLMRGFAIKAFLQYYAKVGDWSGGKRWLHEAQRWTSKRRDPSHPALRAVFVRVFDFLVAFRLDEDFRSLLAVVAGAGIDPPEVDVRTRESSERLLHIFQCWREQINLKHSSGERSTNLDCITVVFERLVKSLLAADSQPLHLKESIPAEDQPNSELGDKVGPLENSTPTSPILSPIRSQTEVDISEELITHPTSPAISKSENALTERPGTVDPSEFEKLLKLNYIQQQEFQDIHDKQRAVIEAQEQKLRDLQSTLADLKALVETNVKDQQEAAIIQRQQALQLQEQGDKMRSLEEEIRNWNEPRATTSTSTPPPPYSDDGITKQLRYYLTYAFTNIHPLTVPEIISWGEIARNEPSPRIPNRAFAKAHRRRIFDFICTHSKSGRLSAEILMAEAEAAEAEARARTLSTSETDCATSKTGTAVESDEVGGEQNPGHQSFGWNTCGPPSLPSAISKRPSPSNWASPSNVSTVNPRNGQSRRQFSSTCYAHLRRSSVLASPGASSSPHRDIKTADKNSAKEASRTSDPAFPRGAEYHKRGGRKIADRHPLRKIPNVFRKVCWDSAAPSPSTGSPPTQQRPLKRRTQQQDPPVLRIHKHLTDRVPIDPPTEHESIPKRNIANRTFRVRFYLDDVVRSKGPDPGPGPVFAWHMLRKHASTSVLPPPPLPRKTGDPQGLKGIRKGKPLRVRLKYPDTNSEAFEPHTHLRFVNTKENPAGPKRSQGEVDVLGQWDARMWEL